MSADPKAVAEAMFKVPTALERMGATEEYRERQRSALRRMAELKAMRLQREGIKD
jgi:hypothetical protein